MGSDASVREICLLGRETSTERKCISSRACYCAIILDHKNVLWKQRVKRFFMYLKGQLIFKYMPHVMLLNGIKFTHLCDNYVVYFSVMLNYNGNPITV